METKIVTREALYEKVWARPLTKIAQEYGVSDVALAKICRKLNVPVPGRGYWAKLAAGHQIKKWSLPPTSKEQTATIRPRPRPTVRPEDVLPQPATVAEIGTILLPEPNERSHPLTAKTRRHFADIQRRIARHARKGQGTTYLSGDWPPHDDHGRYCCRDNDGFSLVVSIATLERALNVLDGLAKALAKQWFRFEQVEPDERKRRYRSVTGSAVAREGERLYFHMREGFTRRERTAKELAEAKRKNEYLAKHEYLPNGTLTLELHGQEYAISETFRDGRKEKLENQLGKIVATFVDAVPRQKQLREERERAERERQEEEHRRWLEQQRIRDEKDRLEKLLAEAERAQQCQTLRDYLDRLERTTLRDGELSESGRIWLSESRALINAYDPAIQRLGG